NRHLYILYKNSDLCYIVYEHRSENQRVITMSTDLPIANNNDNTPGPPSTSNETNMYGQGLPLPCAPPALSRPHETPSMANEDNNATLDPTTPTDFTLTSRQQRVLNYLARRRMRSARITKRQTYADLLETQHNNDK